MSSRVTKPALRNVEDKLVENSTVFKNVMKQISTCKLIALENKIVDEKTSLKIDWELQQNVQNFQRQAETMRNNDFRCAC